MSRMFESFEIRPVIEILADDDLGEAMALGQVRGLVQDKEIAATFRRTPDGWFVPLACLEPIMEQVTERIVANWRASGEIYLVGGYEFWHQGQCLFGVASSSSFRFVMQWHEAIQQLEDTGHARVWISSQTWFRLVLSGALLEIQRFGMETQPRFVFQFAEYRAQLDIVRAQLRRFTEQFFPAISQLYPPDTAWWIAKDLGFTPRQRQQELPMIIYVAMFLAAVTCYAIYQLFIEKVSPMSVLGDVCVLMMLWIPVAIAALVLFIKRTIKRHRANEIIAVKDQKDTE